MDKKIQKELLKFIANSNETKGIAFSMIVDEISKNFIFSGKKYDATKVLQNLKLLQDNHKIEGNFDSESHLPHSALRITTIGYEDLDPWYKRAWRFFTNDMAKILAVLATILSIISMLVSLSK